MDGEEGGGVFGVGGWGDYGEGGVWEVVRAVDGVVKDACWSGVVECMRKGKEGS